VGLPGGFVGVDIFFVISGFVITSSILRQTQSKGHLDLRAFYQSRATRLLPGFLLVLLPTLFLSFLFFDPYFEYPAIASAAISGVLFSANFYFASVNSYDDLGENPLRHLWSLGVEEHFYLLFPLVFYFLYRKFAGSQQRQLLRLRYTLTVLLLTSLILSLTAHYLAPSIIELLGYPELRQYALETGRRLSFFFSPLRAWEILIGCLIATIRLNYGARGSKLRTLISILGALSLSLSMMRLSDADEFPGLLASVPVLATAALIVFCPGSHFERLLSVSPLVYLGNISYSLYLWHWPIMVISQRSIDHLWANALISISVSLGLAAVSTSYFENKFRSRVWSLRILWPIPIMILLFLGVADLLRRSDGFQNLYPKTESKTSNFAAAYGCATSPIGWESSCVFGDKDAPTKVYLFGDSNARSASDGLSLAASNSSWSLTISALSACPVNFSEIQTSDYCATINDQRRALLESKPPSVVVIVNHWTNYLTIPAYGTVEQQLASLETTLGILQELSIPSIVQYQVPICEFRNQPISFRLFEGRITHGRECLAREDEKTMRLEMGEGVSRLVDNCDSAPCKLVDLSPILCLSTCRPFQGSINIFADESHISPSASRLTSAIYQASINRVLEQTKTLFGLHSDDISMMRRTTTSFSRALVWTSAPSNSLEP
jgi:peptidoglycan/LPS O-acetylase OafA/YrhL